jgi:hypothetical protein
MGFHLGHGQTSHGADTASRDSGGRMDYLIPGAKMPLTGKLIVYTLFITF